MSRPDFLAHARQGHDGTYAVSIYEKRGDSLLVARSGVVADSDIGAMKQVAGEALAGLRYDQFEEMLDAFLS